MSDFVSFHSLRLTVLNTFSLLVQHRYQSVIIIIYLDEAIAIEFTRHSVMQEKAYITYIIYNN